MKKNDQYTIEAIDVDGDGVPDGDLITKISKGKIVSRKFVPYKKLKEIADTVKTSGKVVGAKKLKIQKKRPLPTNEPVTNPVIVQDQTTFGQLIKQGAGREIGKISVDVVADELGKLFD